MEYSLLRGEMQPAVGTATGYSDWSWRVDFKMQALMLDESARPSEAEGVGSGSKAGGRPVTLNCARPALAYGNSYELRQTITYHPASPALAWQLLEPEPGQCWAYA